MKTLLMVLKNASDDDIEKVMTFLNQSGLFTNLEKIEVKEPKQEVKDLKSSKDRW